MNKKEKIVELESLWRDEFYVCSVIRAREILHEYPDEFPVLLILGNALTALDRFDKAIIEIEKANKIATSEQRYRALVAMAFVLHQRGAYTDAESWYSKAFLCGAPRPVDVVFYAECQIKSSNHAAAIELLIKSVDSSSEEKDYAYYTLGIAYRAAENYEHALDCFRKVVSIDESYEGAKEAIDDIVESMNQKPLLHIV